MLLEVLKWDIEALGSGKGFVKMSNRKLQTKSPSLYAYLSQTKDLWNVSKWMLTNGSVEV